MVLIHVTRKAIGIFRIDYFGLGSLIGGTFRNGVRFGSDIAPVVSLGEEGLCGNGQFRDRSILICASIC